MTTPYEHRFQECAATPPQQNRWPHFALRLLSGIGGVFVLLTSALFSLGTSLAAPLGILVAQRRARRRGRLFTHGTSWLGAIAASSVTVLLAFGVLMAVIPRSTFREMRDAAAAAQTQDAGLPEWMRRAFPQGARPDPLTQKVVNSPAFVLYFGMVGLVLSCAFLGTIAGSAGWVGATLLRYALSGRRAA